MDDAVRTVSRAFGSAVSGGPVAPGFAAVAAAVRARADRDEDRMSIGDLLSAARLPAEWLAEVVVTQMFLPGDESNGATLTPYLKALSENPAAARLAIAPATGDSPLPRDAMSLLAHAGGTSDRRPGLVAFLRDLNRRTSGNAESADAFGRLLAAASGAYDERDGRTATSRRGSRTPSSPAPRTSASPHPRVSTSPR
ncbi:hypothetical protein F5972_05475 [Microbispora cellulosiformans]|uniref:Uncharacterized protein n=1 Tax=Microbispora cellulosiformans TaxID=2614688 RepID=A0A5J5K7F0_9ACTN|nr:hypothetical protein [Microbispora cellulosiformans]KAA9380581.1 hypothetical protein F5972_05475 [Microbispora cellulosiformans]